MLINQMRFKWREFFSSGPRWRLWVAVLLVVGGISVYSFYQNRSGPGNFTPLTAGSASSSSAVVEQMAASSGSSYEISNTTLHAAGVSEKQSAAGRMVIQSSVLNMETSHVSKWTGCHPTASRFDQPIEREANGSHCIYPTVFQSHINEGHVKY